MDILASNIGRGLTGFRVCHEERWIVEICLLTKKIIHDVISKLRTGTSSNSEDTFYLVQNYSLPEIFNWISLHDYKYKTLMAKTKIKYLHKEDFWDPTLSLSLCREICLLCLFDSILFCKRKSNDTENCVMQWSSVRLDFVYNFLNPFVSTQWNPVVT